MKARIVNIQKFSLHDGPGIRTLVFFKGCPLRCLWCANPECINVEHEIGFNRALCDHCGQCVEACPQQAIVLDESGLLRIERTRCNACGQCVTACTREALAIYGREVLLEELFREVQSDAIFYRGSGGGVTVSGGEPLLQIDFVTALFQLCHEANISTVVETCGHVSKEIMSRILPLVDFIFYDLKAIHEGKHRALTGRGNGLILDNARMVAESGVPLQFRMPLVPGYNDDIDNIKGTAEFLHSLNIDRPSIELMPYHRLGMGKYDALERDYPLRELDMAGTEAVDRARRCFEEYGITCLVSR
jgi:pyruvate formate lyase activating enzyme